MKPPKLRGFRLEEPLGRGGMGEVFRAYDETLERWVAVKVIRSRAHRRSKARQRFRREARLAAQISHPAAVQIHQIFESGSQDYIVMELVEGQTLRELLNAQRLDLSCVLRLLWEVAEGLAFAHAKGIIHRDLKAGNVMVTRDGHAKILDFGLAKRLHDDESSISGEGSVVGTYHYMSPEQARGLDLDHRSDLYSLGVLLYRASTHRAPFDGKTSAEVLLQICTHRQTPAHRLESKVPMALSDLIDRLLEKDRESRPWSTKAVASALSTFEREAAESTTLARSSLGPGLAEAASGLSGSTGSSSDPDTGGSTESWWPPQSPGTAGVSEANRDSEISTWDVGWMASTEPTLITGPTESDPRPILFVDAEEHNCTVFEAAFGDDYSVFTAASAREALDVLRRVPIHLVLADQRMTEITGVQLLESLADQYPETVRILLTGFVDIEATIRAINTGSVHRYVTKPWNERELRVIIDQALESQALRRLQKRLGRDLERQADRETHLRRMFQKYAPSAVVDELLDRSNIDRFLGEARVVAILMSDIRDFADLTCHLDPPQLVAFLNRYFSRMSRIVARLRGRIHRYRRDALVAVFGAPVSSIHVAEDALQAALEMLEAVDALGRDEAVTLRGAPMQISIGVHLGEVIAGNIGSDVRMEYTVVGHPMAVAARVHGRSKEFPNSILVSDNAHDWAGELVTGHSVEEVEMRDGSEGLRLFRILP